MNLEPFTGPGSTTSRRALWDKVFAAVMSARKIEGKNASVTEYEGQGTLVAFKRDRGGPAPGVCPEVENVTCTLAGITLNCGCIDIYDGEVLLARWYWTDPYNDLNKPHTLTRDTVPNEDRWFLTDAGTIHIAAFDPDDTCPTDPPVSEDDVTFHIDAYCADGVWTVFVFFGASPISLFMYGSGATDETISNITPHCGFPEFIVSMGGFTVSAIGANTDGTAVISL